MTSRPRVVRFRWATASCFVRTHSQWHALRPQNHRIHCYLSYRRLKWKPDVVNSVLSKHFTCQFSFGVQCDAYNRRYCDKNHEAAKNQKTRRSTDNKRMQQDTRRVVRTEVTCSEVAPRSVRPTR
ncbi:hypothetical protein GQ600_15150 [Phytophthora cactorum]|nr:hypothetical protein GQ600_15150 [Phytophthora cactorum]